MRGWRRKSPIKILHDGAVFALSVAWLAGCVTGPDYRPQSFEQLRVPAQFTAMVSSAPEAAINIERWWEAFNDPTLTTLVEDGLRANLDIQQAGARLRQARASLAGTRSRQFPTLSASISASRTVGSEDDSTLFQAGFDAAYELDVFGGTRRSVEAATATAQAREADLHSTQLAIAAEISLNYLEARSAQSQLEVARDTLASLDETVEIVGFRVQAGLVGSLDLEQARQFRAQEAAAIPITESNYSAAANRLAILLGERPGAVTDLVGAGAEIPLAPVAAAIPADVIRRRPDIAASERALAAEVARIGVETANLYPAFQLSGSFGGSGFSLGDVVDAAAGSLGAGITAPIFNGGQLRAAVEAQTASADAALAAYRQTVLTALEDVENAFVALDAIERRERELVVAEEAATNAVLLARTQYQAGLIDFQALLESERSVLSSRQNRVGARADRAAAIVQLSKALGGGWEAAPQPQSVLSSETAR